MRNGQSIIVMYDEPFIVHIKLKKKTRQLGMFISAKILFDNLTI